MSGDLPAEELRAALHRVADMVADYLGGVGEYPVLPRVEPGAVTAQLSSSPPVHGESIDDILDDYKRIIEPNVTHWNHPGFLAYFAITGSAPGIIGESLAAALNVNAMLWRSSPAATELEGTACSWLRQMVDLPEDFQGHINDTASTSTLVALAAARHRPRELGIRELGMAGRVELPQLTVYISEQAHSSCDKAAMTLGLGLENVRRVPVDERFALRPRALETAIREDLAAGRRPLAVVATAGTTATTSIDPMVAIADICSRYDLWLHVDAAYAGSAAVCPELRELFVGWERADSIVINPHKWLFTPIDCSVLFVRDVEELRSTFTLIPSYLTTAEEGVTNLMDLGFQLGRRFRALKLWMVIRSFGVAGIAERIREHCRLASRLSGRIEEHPDFAVVAPVLFSTVCFRWQAGESAPQRESLNRRLLDEINADGAILLSHAVLDGQFTLRLTIGNLKTDESHVERAWQLIVDTAERVRTATEGSSPR